MEQTGIKLSRSPFVCHLIPFLCAFFHYAIAKFGKIIFLKMSTFDLLNFSIVSHTIKKSVQLSYVRCTDYIYFIRRHCTRRNISAPTTLIIILLLLFRLPQQRKVKAVRSLGALEPRPQHQMPLQPSLSRQTGLRKTTHLRTRKRMPTLTPSPPASSPSTSQVKKMQ